MCKKTYKNATEAKSLVHHVSERILKSVSICQSLAFTFMRLLTDVNATACFSALNLQLIFLTFVLKQSHLQQSEIETSVVFIMYIILQANDHYTHNFSNMENAIYDSCSSYEREMLKCEDTCLSDWLHFCNCSAISIHHSSQKLWQ